MGAPNTPPGSRTLAARVRRPLPGDTAASGGDKALSGAVLATKLAELLLHLASRTSPGLTLNASLQRLDAGPEVGSKSGQPRRDHRRGIDDLAHNAIVA